MNVRSALFVPGDRPERLPKALASGADAVIADLEDAVEPGAKAHARQAVQDYLDTHPEASVVLRINDVDSPHFAGDLALCASRPGVAAVMLPKAETAAAVALAAASGKPVWPIVETARAVLALPEVVRAPGVAQLVFGSLDLSVDLDLDFDSDAGRALLDDARHRLLLHARVAGLRAPLDGVHPRLDDEAGLRREAERARGAGMAGMLCIHPAQVAAVNQAFSPTPAELDWAWRVLESAKTSPGAFRLDGRMIDAPVLRRARRLVDRSPGH